MWNAAGAYWGMQGFVTRGGPPFYNTKKGAPRGYKVQNFNRVCVPKPPVLAPLAARWRASTVYKIVHCQNGPGRAHVAEFVNYTKDNLQYLDPAWPVVQATRREVPGVARKILKCARACMRACVHACVRACVRA